MLTPVFAPILFATLLAVLPGTAHAQAAWQGLDIGAVGLAGADHEADGVVTISASGADIFDRHDAFHFRAQERTGDGAMYVHVASRGSGHAWAKIGVMFREDLGDDAREVMLFVTPQNHFGLQYRSEVGGLTTSIDFGSPYGTDWLMLVREGNTFRAYRDTSAGDSWILMGSATVAMAPGIYGGLAVSSHNNGALLTATFNHAFQYEGPPPPLYRPAAPWDFSFSDPRQTVLHLKWNVVAGAAAYELERATGGSGGAAPAEGDYTLIATLAPDIAQYTDSGLTPHTAYYYRIRTRRDTPILPYSTYATAAGGTTEPMPPGYPWTYWGASVATQTGGTLTLETSGDGVGGTGDFCGLYYWRAANNVDISARITGITNPSPLAEAGLMIRADLGEDFSYDAIQATMVLTAGGGSTFISRAAKGATAQVVPGPTVTFPSWVRLTRVGNLLSGYVSTDGVHWTLVGSQTIVLGPEVTVACVGSSHAGSSVRSTATFDNFLPPLEVRPDPPWNLRVTTVMPGAVRLAWEDNSSNETSFEIGRWPPTGSSQREMTIMTAPANATTFEDTTVAQNTDYGYAVRASRGSGGTSDWTTAAYVKVPASPAMAPPGNLRATASTSSTIQLAWDDNSSAETGFQLERGDRWGYSFSLVATLPANTVTYTDTALISDFSYSYRLRAVGSGGGSYSEYSAPLVAGTQRQLADSWSGADIGAVGTAGSTDSPGGGFVLHAGGGDFWGPADAGRIHYRAWHGNSSITARVTGLTNTNPWAKAGVMIRESLAPGSRHAAMVLTAGNSCGFQARATPGGETEFTAGPWVHPVYWVRLTRAGNLFSGYISPDGTNWTLVGSKTMTLDADVLIGLEASAHASGVQTTASFDQIAMASDPSAPAAPSSLQVGGVSSSLATIGWTNNATDATALQIERADDVGGFVLIKTLPMGTGYAAVTSYTDTTLSPGVYYQFHVRAVRGESFSDYSNVVAMTTPANQYAVSAPTNLHVDLAAATSLRLVWENHGSWSHLQLERRVHGVGRYELIASPGAAYTSATDYNDTGLAPGTAYDYRLRTLQAGSASEYVFLAASTSPAEGGGWAGGDIGGVGMAGSTTVSSDGNTFTLKAGGGDIEGTVDAFRLQYVQWHGDGSITARVTSLTNTHAWAKAGVMIREDFAPGARNAAMVLTAGNVCGLQARSATAGSTEFTSGAWLNPVYWVRLTRVGNVFSGYVSPDGTTWTLVGSKTVVMAADVLMGLAASAHSSSGAQTSAVFDHMTLASTTPPPPPPASTWNRAQMGGSTGSYTESSGTMQLTATSGDYWGTSDSGLFVFQDHTGDATVMARLTQTGPANDWMKAGLMIRPAAGDAAGVNAFIAFTGSHGHVFQARSVAATQTTSQGTGQPGATQWLKLTRTGSTFSGYISLDNRVTWTLVGTATFTMRPEIQVGLALSSHNTGTASTATFADFTIE